jgi:alpha-L-rhamnosidase
MFSNHMPKHAFTRIAFLTLLIYGSIHAVETQTARINLAELKCEHHPMPVGVQAAHPRFSWKLKATSPDARGLRQAGYRILVASMPELLEKNTGDLWDSGPIKSDTSISIPYAGKPLQSAATYHWKVQVLDSAGRESAWSPPARWEMGFLKPEDWKAGWIVARAEASKEDGRDASYLRRMFTLDEIPQSAVVRVNVLGWFELYVNGVKVSDDVLSPAYTDYSKRSLYLTYDLKPYLRKGPNCIGLQASRGWYWPGKRGVQHNSAVARLQLDMLIGGKPVMLGTDDTWRSKPSGRSIISKWVWNGYGGEQIDANLDDPHWNQPDSTSNGWQPVAVVPAPPIPAEAQRNPADKVIKTIPAVACVDRGKGVYTLDFGTNLAGWLNLRLPRLEAGQVVTFDYSDREDATRVFNQRDRFVSAGKDGEVFTNKFNYNGFRYVTISALPSKPELAAAEAFAVGASWEPAGNFECSNSLINRMHEVNVWTLKALSTGGYMSDCPHRERDSFGGDGFVSIESCMMNFDMSRFYTKWMTDWHDVQTDDGFIPPTAHHGIGGGGPAWSGALQQIAWRNYLYYGDNRALTENFEACLCHVEFLESRRMKDGLLQPYGGTWGFLGDWAPPGPANRMGFNFPSDEEAKFFNNCYFAHQIDHLSRMAAVLGRVDESKNLADRANQLKARIHTTYYNPEKKQYINDKQAYLVMPLMSGVTPDPLRDGVSRSLADTILIKNNGHIDTGLTATPFLQNYLQETDNNLLWSIVTQTDHPGWGHMLAKGATTWWEQWHGGKTTHIHACFAGLDQWFYQALAGIRPDPTGPGFKKFIIKPALVGDLTWVKAHHDSPHGKIVSEWTRKDGQLKMHVVVPANTTATIHVPTKDATSVTERGKPAAQSAGVTFLRTERGAAVFEVGSGAYDFAVF